MAGQDRVLRLSVDASEIAGQDGGNINWILIRNAVTPPAPVTWTSAAPFPIAIEEQMSATVGGKLYAFGGLYSSSYLATDRVEVYDAATNTWSARRAMPEKLAHAATVVDGTTVWFIGGYVGDHPGPDGSTAAISNVWPKSLDASRWMSRFTISVADRKTTNTRPFSAAMRFMPQQPQTPVFFGKGATSGSNVAPSSRERATHT